MTFPEPLKKLVLYAVLTEKCPYCGTLLSFRGGFCPSCKNNIPVIEKKRCKYCGAEKERCNCRHRRMKYDGITAPFYYEGPVKTAIKRFKFNGKDFLSEFLGGQMAFSAVQDFSNISFDFITYVPFSEQQKRARPYNQSELLAEVLAKKLNLPLRDALVKPFETGIQHRLSGKNRSGNVAGAYDVSPKCDVSGKIILLADDIKTTGATLNECAKVLKIRGAKRVYCVTAALSGGKARKEEEDK